MKYHLRKVLIYISLFGLILCHCLVSKGITLQVDDLIYGLPRTIDIKNPNNFTLLSILDDLVFRSPNLHGKAFTRVKLMNTTFSNTIQSGLIISAGMNVPVIVAAAIFLILSLIFLILFLYNRKKYMEHLHEIADVIDSISQKDFDKKVKEDRKGDLGNLAKLINTMSGQLKEEYHNLEIRVIRRTSAISLRNAELRKKQREILKQNHEIKSAYDALKESREKYEKLIMHLEDEYIFYSQSTSGSLLFVSPSVEKILGYNVKEYRQICDSIYTDNPINIHARECSEKSRAGNAQPRYIKEIYNVDKQPVVLEVSEVPVFNEHNQLVSIEGLAHNITERQRSEELIKEQEEKFRMIFTYASDFIILYDIDKKKKKAGKIIEANNYAINKLGFTIEELRDMTLMDLIAAEIWKEEGEDFAEYTADGGKYERIWASKDNIVFDVEISSHAFKIRNRDVAIAVARDITERKKTEEEIRFINDELYNQKENLETIVDNLTQTQEQLVQSEKMAALGQLIAGIAHEINTPLGAIKASIGNLSDSLDGALDELPFLFQTKSEENLNLFQETFSRARERSPELTSREKRQKKRELAAKLGEQEVEDASMFADLLTYLGIYEVEESYVQQLKIPEAMRVIKSARSFISLLKNTNTINIAVEKATKVVFALKKYAHRDSGGEKVSTDIIDSIETVLTLYNNQLKQGIEVEKNYDPLPLVQCYQDEISQVWTNLIQNAIQAMNQVGVLTILTKNEKDQIMVSFKDSGPGIEPDIKEKIFEPFFTTKKQGEGSGLGLDIVKKIVDKHNGTIYVDSKLGEGANFIIKIPVN